MSIDFMSIINKRDDEKEVNPIKIYEQLDRESITGELRKDQEEILSEWHEKRRSLNDLIIKLNTGSGKTLIGLLILQSKINETKESGLYVCPNKYLADQVRKEADKFGIKYSEITQDNKLPREFINGEKLLITHVQKLFNGKSIFGIKSNSVDISTIILDDSHACIDSIRDVFTIKITKKESESLYFEILELFEDSLKEQGEGTYLDILNGESNDFIQIPYWEWIDKSSQTTKILKDNKEDNSILFSWDILKDSIKECTSFLDSQVIEIRPSYIPIEIFKSFSSARHKILMSATTQDDSFFINGLGLSRNSIEDPLTILNEKWFGEKMILIPSVLDKGYVRRNILSLFNSDSNKKLGFGIVALTPSFKHAELYEKGGFELINSENINNSINELRSKKISGKRMVLSNRYDGIDLPDNSCRILIFDSIPYFNSLYDRYEYRNRQKSDLILRKMAQKIEQGLGRAVRGEKDYCVVLVLGEDLVDFVGNNKNREFLSKQTRTQLDIGFEMGDILEEHKNKQIETDGNRNKNANTVELINQLIKRDEGWKYYYQDRMNNSFKNQDILKKSNLLDILEIEKKAEKSYYLGMYDEAIKHIDTLIGMSIDKNEKSWYLEKKGRYNYGIDRSVSNELQIEAFKINNSLLKPKEGIIYKKINHINEDRIGNIINYINKFKDYEQLDKKIELLLRKLSFGEKSESFESALDEFGIFLGFQTDRPDKLFRKGPDNLWSTKRESYIFFECKNEVKKDRKIIKKDEVGQMNNHCGWFEEVYGHQDVLRVIIIPTNIVSKNANFTHDVKIMDLLMLEKFKSNIRSFFKSLIKSDISNLSKHTINNKLESYELTIEDLTNNYFKEIVLEEDA